MNIKKDQIYPNWKNITKIQKYKKQDLDNLLENYIENKKEIYKNIKNIKKEDRNFENTILALENCDNDFEDIFHQLRVYAMTHKNKEYRDLVSDFEKTLSEKSVDLEYDKDIYLSIKDYIESNYKKEKKNLDNKYGEGSVLLVDDFYKGYKKMGFDLPKIKQDKFKNNLKKLSNLSIDFSKNIDEYRDFILIDKEEIKGLPENFIQTLEKVKENNIEKYKVTLDYPSIGPFLQYADSREKRKEITDKSYKKGGQENIKILADIVKLRDENAKILGYKNHVEFNVSDRMVKTEKRARDFVESLIKKLKTKSDKELEELSIFARENLSQYKDIKKIEYYDIAYLANKLKENKYSYDSSKLKEYFELNRTLKEMFSLFGELFNFSVTEITDKEKTSILIDKDIKLYELKDKKTKEAISYLILDLFPREGKYGHACSSNFLNSKYLENKRVVPINQLICNFSKPKKSLPALLSLGDVDTLFHEFGHALHFMLTDCVYNSQAGYNVVWDFVETPSQMLENFLFEEKNLKKLAVHYKTKKVLDKEIINKIIKGKNFLNKYSYLRQNVMSLFDLDLHSNKFNSKDSAKYYNSLVKKYFDFDLPKDAIFSAGFGHLMGYDAGYYSYMWALVYADDFYSEFKKVLNNKSELKKIGEIYRKEILNVGGSRDENMSVKKFLGRDFNNKAFLESLGM